jgi:Ion channel
VRRNLHRHHGAALATIAAAVVLDAILGIWFGAADHVGIPDGLYFAVVTGTTTGYGDIVPRGWLPHVLACMIMILVIPLFTATFSLFTSGLASQDMHARLAAAEQRIKEHTETRLRHHLKGAPGDPQN